MSLVVGYLRVSTDEQADSGLGLDAQRAAIAAEANRRDWAVTWIEDAGASGKNINSGLRRALDLAETGQVAGIVVAKMDRLARSVRHAADIMHAASQQGWNLVILDGGIDLGTPSGRAMAAMLATFSEYEREMISKRTKDALAQRKSRGLPIGRPRLARPEIVRRIVVERQSGRSFRAIALDLTASHLMSPSGRPTWQESSVRRIYQATQREQIAS
jgi:DNA invertase Pin-like site-specific DNA recombinase